jgi:hypothetical protein
MNVQAMMRKKDTLASRVMPRTRKSLFPARSLPSFSLFGGLVWSAAIPSPLLFLLVFPCASLRWLFQTGKTGKTKAAKESPHSRPNWINNKKPASDAGCFVTRGATVSFFPARSGRQTVRCSCLTSRP